jgi:hypothetical protein
MTTPSAPLHSSISRADVASQTLRAWPDAEDDVDADDGTRRHVVFETVMAALAIIGVITIACAFAIISVMVDNDDTDACVAWKRRLETYASLRAS